MSDFDDDEDPEVAYDRKLRSYPDRPGVSDDKFGKLLEEVTRNAAGQTYARQTCAVCGHVTTPFYVKCPQCEGDRNRKAVDRLAEVIVRIKNNPPRNREEERAAMKQLVASGHPEPFEFLKAIQKRLEKPDAPKPRRKADV